ncbi:SAM-dependent methyltransferase [Terrimonas sp.]|uniref:class I SAM-dependent methyltransferase n=1 Tax=Terrimonas sp. TaxID=1914338 RepID=UPI000D50BC7C|nr:class I SAM-dependent methyltransferase [Terrimonas sp.]PVD51530.1 SAM-dependent methyltransferase [Terrimonas sp.]
MTKQFWDQRYTDNETLYGNKPNNFFKLFIDLHKPGTLLLPAEGEGRNAIYAASKGWQVDAFDYSEVAKAKALANAKVANVHINYWVADIDAFKATKQYDAVALIYTHVPPDIRKKFHAEMMKSLNSTGFLILEAFGKEQLALSSGGPKDEAMLYDAPSLCNDFRLLHILNCEQKHVFLEEGKFHYGEASVLRLSGQKL